MNSELDEAIESSEIDLAIDRRSSDSVKWGAYPDGVLPLWVADMDFRSPDAVLRALHGRVEHGIFGYGKQPHELTELIAARLAERYDWHVSPEEISLLPGVVPGIYLCCQALSEAGEGIVVQTPVYPPIRNAPIDTGRTRTEIGFLTSDDGQHAMDWEAFDKAIEARAKAFILCNPQNPTGRVFTRDELERIARRCLSHRVAIVSDEIHADLVFPGHRHIPIASLAPEIARSTITLMAPSKTYNLAGLDCSFAVIQDRDLRARFHKARAGLVPHVNLLGVVAALAAYREGQPWLDRVLSYLAANRQFLQDQIRETLPPLRFTPPEGTYLGWLDCRRSVAGAHPYRFFLSHAKVALSDGALFGPGGAGFVRINFGCRRVVLEEALRRMRVALG